VHFKALLATLMMVVMQSKSVCFNNNKIKGIEELMVILNSTLLHNQNDGLTVP
jgi:hypothetical protein